jgi:hypothetical protein
MVIIDEAERLSAAATELVRDIFDRTERSRARLYRAENRSSHRPIGDDLGDRVEAVLSVRNIIFQCRRRRDGLDDLEPARFHVTAQPRGSRRTDPVGAAAFLTAAGGGGSTPG